MPLKQAKFTLASFFNVRRCLWRVGVLIGVNRRALRSIPYIVSASTIPQDCAQVLLTNRETINEELQVIIDEHTEPWGVKVSAVEVRDVVIPEAMQRSMAGQAEAERERRAKIIAAEGEYQASERLSQ